MLLLETNDSLKKEIGFFPALSTVMGTVIGAGVFFKAAAVYKETGSASLGMFAWLLAGLITIAAGLTGAELAAAIPKTGGLMAYIKHTYGELAGFLLGWAQTIIYFPANIAALSIIFATQFINLFHLSVSISIPIAIIVAASITFINFLGSKVAGSFQSITLICKLVPIVLIVIFGLMQPNPETISLFPSSGTAVSSNTLTALGNGLLATMFAYDGWIHVGNMSGEMKNPKKDLPKAITIGLLSVMAVYLLINMAYLLSLPVDSIAGNENASMEVANKIFGPLGGKIITIGILISVYGTINGYTMTGMRIPYAMAKDGMFPMANTFAKLSKTKVPVNSGFLVLAISILMIFSGQFDVLTDMLVFVIWLFYTMAFVAVIILRKREPELERPYKVPLYPFIPLVAIVGGLFILTVTLITKTTLALIGIVLTLIGVPVYYYIKKNMVNNK